MPTGDADARHANPYLVQMPTGGLGLPLFLKTKTARLQELKNKLAEVEKQIIEGQAKNQRFEDSKSRGMSQDEKFVLADNIRVSHRQVGGLYTKKRELENKISFLENELQTPVPSAPSSAGCSCASGAAVKSRSSWWPWTRG